MSLNAGSDVVKHLRAAIAVLWCGVVTMRDREMASRDIIIHGGSKKQLRATAEVVMEARGARCRL